MKFIAQAQYRLLAILNVDNFDKRLTRISAALFALCLCSSTEAQKEFNRPYFVIVQILSMRPFGYDRALLSKHVQRNFLSKRLKYVFH